MKFNVKLPGQEGENEPNSNPDEQNSADSSPEDPTSAPLKRVTRLRLPIANPVEDKPEIDPGEEDEAPGPEAKPDGPSITGPQQAGANTDVDSFFQEFFEDEDESVEVIDDLEEDEYSDPDGDSFSTQWEDFLSDDDDESPVSETVESPSRTVAQDRKQSSESSNPFLDEDEDQANPFLQDEEDDEDPFDGTVPARGNSAEVETSSAGTSSKLAGEKTSSDSPGAPVSGAKAKRIVVPPKPELSPDDSEALQKREEASEATRARKRHRGKVGSPDDLDAQVGLEQKISYEVTVTEDGRERSESKGVASKKRKGKESGQEKSPGEQVEVTDANGKAKWVARAEAGRINDGQLALFRNLHQASGSEKAEETMRELFSRAAADAPDDATARRRKKLANRAIFGEEALLAGSRKRFTEKDREVLRFIGMFKYANAKHIANVQSVKEDTMLRRLYSLGERGLVVKKDLYGAKPLWYLTEAGIICSGLEVPRVKESGITFSMLPHQFVVNHIAGNLWGAGVNVLALEDFPDRFRRNEAGDLVLGETLVSEYEVQSSFASAKAANHKADVYRPAIKGALERDFRRWQVGGMDPEGSPEMTLGNEYMWTLFPPIALKLAYHVPDLVVKRPRLPDGRPQSIAVEVELANKPLAAYERALGAYKYDSVIYGKVVWVVKSRGAARKIQEAAKKLDIWAEGKVGIVPIYTEDGVFKGKAVWTI